MLVYLLAIRRYKAGYYRTNSGLALADRAMSILIAVKLRTEIENSGTITAIGYSIKVEKYIYFIPNTRLHYHTRSCVHNLMHKHSEPGTRHLSPLPLAKPFRDWTAVLTSTFSILAPDWSDARQGRHSGIWKIGTEMASYLRMEIDAGKCWNWPLLLLDVVVKELIRSALSSLEVAGYELRMAAART
jgi:hypothetical protein